MKVYTSRDVSKLLNLSVQQIRSYAREGFLEPERGPRGEYRFSFQDLVLLRTAKGLLDKRIPARKVRRALRRLRQQLPSGQPLTGVQITTDREQVLVRDGETLWDPDSGQSYLNFDVVDLAKKVATHATRLERNAEAPERKQTAEEWYSLGSDLEAAAPDEARDSYRRALELDPRHTDARINLGRLLHEGGYFASAEAQYRMVLSFRVDDPIALFNLAVCLEDQNHVHDAIDTYLRAIRADSRCADAYYNVARLYERLGDSVTALAHLKTYRKLTSGH